MSAGPKTCVYCGKLGASMLIVDRGYVHIACMREENEHRSAMGVNRSERRALQRARKAKPCKR